MKQSDVSVATKPIVEAFEIIDVPYFIGGSITSSAYGIARATMDVDIVADIKPQQVHTLVSILTQAYYLIILLS